MPLDSPKFATIDWPYLDYILADGTTGREPLFTHATQNGGTYENATASFTMAATKSKNSIASPFGISTSLTITSFRKVECAFVFTGQGAGHAHIVTVAGQAYTYIEQAGDSNTGISTGLAAALSACPDVSAVRGDGTAELGPVNQLNIRAARADGSMFDVAANGVTYHLTGVSAASIARAFAAQINSTNWSVAGALFPLRAETDDASLRLIADRPGVDGNTLRMYSVAKNDRLKTTSDAAVFSGGSSDAIWRVTLDFSALGLQAVRQMWLTFAPPLANGAAFETTEWQAEFTNWTLTGPDEIRTFKVAGPGSVRIEEDDSWCKYSGTWTDETGFFSEGYAKHASSAGSSVTIKYSCSSPHDLYLGTSLYSDRATVAVQLDGGAETSLDCKLSAEPAVNSRRKVRSLVAPGEHSVTLRLTTPGHFYFDFLEAVVPTDVPDPMPVRNNVSPALDYSTDQL